MASVLSLIDGCSLLLRDVKHLHAASQPAQGQARTRMSSVLAQDSQNAESSMPIVRSACRSFISRSATTAPSYKKGNKASVSTGQAWRELWLCAMLSVRHGWLQHPLEMSRQVHQLSQPVPAPLAKLPQYTLCMLLASDISIKHFVQWVVQPRLAQVV